MLKKVSVAVRSLIRRNAKHRKGFRLNELEDGEILEHIADEVQELRDEPNDLDEFADIVAGLEHYQLRKGWTDEMVEEAVLKKLGMRFEKEHKIEVT